MQYRVHEKLTFSENEKSLEHEPVWVLLKRVPTDSSMAEAPHGGWRLCARLHDKAAPSGVGSEVKAQIPPLEMKKQTEAMWDAQKTTLKEQRHTLAGWFARLMLR